MKFTLKILELTGDQRKIKELENLPELYSHTGGRWFKSITAYHNKNNGLEDFRVSSNPFFYVCRACSTAWG